MKKNIACLIMLAVLFSACSKMENTNNGVIRAQEQFTTFASYSVSNWTSGSMPSTGNPSQLIVPDYQLLPLNVSKASPIIYKCNNPEIFTGTGWLMQTSRTDPTRGGSTYALKDTNNAYLFHINQSGSTKYLHLIVTNPNAFNINVIGKGSYYTNAEKPLSGKGTGQSYWVSKDWLNGSLRVNPGSFTSIAQYQAAEIFSCAVGNSNMIDGRFQIITSDNAYYYTVVTNTSSLSDALTTSQGSYAPGTYATESTNTYGREAGVYQYSEISAENDLDIPSAASHVGFCLNTTNKFDSYFEDQTASNLMTLSGASSHTYGNYGHHYKIVFHLHNNNSINKTVNLYFASNSIDSTKSNATWNGQLKMNGSYFDVYTQLNAPRQQLSSWNIPPGLFNATIEFYVPGLITANQQLIFEVPN